MFLTALLAATLSASADTTGALTLEAVGPATTATTADEVAVGTIELETKEEREIYVRTTLRELIVYSTSGELFGAEVVLSGLEFDKDIDTSGTWDVTFTGEIAVVVSQDDRRGDFVEVIQVSADAWGVTIDPDTDSDGTAAKPGMSKYSNVTLKRGLMDASEEDWEIVGLAESTMTVLELSLTSNVIGVEPDEID